MNFENELSKLAGVIKEENEFLLLSHVLPDGDSIGSVIAFAEVLKQLGKNVKIMLRDPVPEIYKFLLHNNEVYNLQTIDKANIPRVFIVLDCSEILRIGEELQFLIKSAKKIINIDHHISNDSFGDINLVKPDSAATCELLYDIFEKLNFCFSKKIASALYTGIITDTGGFRYENTSKTTFYTAAKLMEHEIDLAEIRENIYENISLKSINILKKALSNLSLSSNGKIAWLHLTARDMAEENAMGEHCEGIVNYPLSISGVKLGFFFREMHDGKIKVGLRGRKGYSVNKIAALFGGGGHAQAAGCTLDGPLNEAINKVITAAEESLKEG